MRSCPAWAGASSVGSRDSTTTPASSTSTTSAELVDHRTKLVVRDRCLELPRHQATAWTGSARSPTASGYRRPDGDTGSLLLVDAAQLAPTSIIDVAELDVDYLAFSFHKVLAPFGVGVLYARESLLERSLPFLYGGDMIAEGKVSPAAWSTTSSPGSTSPAPRTCSESSPPPKHSGSWSTWRWTPPSHGSTTPDHSPGPEWSRPWAWSTGTSET